MKQPSVYLKMRVLGAIDTVQGKTRHQRIRNVAAMTFLDEEGHSRQFTWRTIQTWHYRYKNHGITGVTQQTRKDKGQARKVTPEELLEALNAAKPHFHDRRVNKRAFYRYCVEHGLLHPDRIAQTTFYRFLREYQLLAPDNDDNKKRRLAFSSMKFANQLWQADTVCSAPMSTAGGSRKQAKLIAFLDDASRVLCHGEFFLDENTDTLVAGHSRAPLSTNAVFPNNSSSTMAPSTPPRKSPSSALASAASCDTPPSVMPRPRGKSNASFAVSAISFWCASSISLHSKRSTASSPTGLNTITTPANTTPSA